MDTAACGFTGRVLPYQPHVAAAGRIAANRTAQPSIAFPRVQGLDGMLLRGPRVSNWPLGNDHSRAAPAGRRGRQVCEKGKSRCSHVGPEGRSRTGLPDCADRAKGSKGPRAPSHISPDDFRLLPYADARLAARGSWLGVLVPGHPSPPSFARVPSSAAAALSHFTSCAGELTPRSPRARRHRGPGGEGA